MSKEQVWHEPAANQRQVDGDHYKKHGENGEQHWDRAWRLGLDPFQYMITRYVERCWDKNGIQDLEKAEHFIQKYIELARMAGRKGARESEKLTVEVTMSDDLKRMCDDALRESKQAWSALDFLLQTRIVNEDGIVQFPDGGVRECLRGKPTDFHYEGSFGDGRRQWRCAKCLHHFHTLGNELPHAVHVQPCTQPPKARAFDDGPGGAAPAANGGGDGSDGSEPTSAYVQQDGGGKPPASGDAAAVQALEDSLRSS